MILESLYNLNDSMNELVMAINLDKALQTSLKIFR